MKWLGKQIGILISQYQYLLGGLFFGWLFSNVGITLGLLVGAMMGLFKIGNKLLDQAEQVEAYKTRQALVFQDIKSDIEAILSSKSFVPIDQKKILKNLAEKLSKES